LNETPLVLLLIILGYGTVIVTGTGSSYVAFKTVADPLKVKRHIDAELDG